MAQETRPVKTTRMLVLADLIRRHKWTRGAEVGVWQGALSGFLLYTFKDLHLLGVDNWAPVGLYANKDMRTAEMMVRTIAAKYAGRFEILRYDTVVAASGIATGSLDFVFIDASHDTASVLADIRAWRPKVRAGGYLTGHDSNLESVRAALDQELPGWSRLEANVWIFPCA